MVDTKVQPPLQYLEDLDTLEEHYLCTQKLLKEYIGKYTELEKIVLANSEYLRVLIEKIDAQTEATKGLVAAWTTANNVMKFIKWISCLGLLGIVITWFISKLPSSW